MSNYPKDRRRQSPSQKAVDRVTVGRDAEINVTQNINQSQLTRDHKSTVIAENLKMLLTKLDEDWLYKFDNGEKLSPERVINLALETHYEFTDKIDKNDIDTNIENIFTDWKKGKRLLILGEPGAGKTTALLQLAKKFREEINDENILDMPIPVMFQLSSWKNYQSIDEWLIQELSIYGFPTVLGESWVKDRRLFLLLDGLDHVNPVDQAQCVKELDKFGASNIVLCSRTHQYKDLYFSRNVRLKVDLSVCIKNLEDDKIVNYLETSNKPGLKRKIDEDEKLKTLAKIPFWLNIITDIDEGADERLPGEGSPKELQHALFEAYIEKRFYEAERKRFDKVERQERFSEIDQKKRTNKHRWLTGLGLVPKYDEKEKIMRWLTWLSSWLVSESKTVFLIEEMQPKCLVTEAQRNLYRTVILCIGTILGLLFGIPYGLTVRFYLSYSWGLSPHFLEAGMVLGIAAGAIVGTSAQFFLKVHEGSINTHRDIFLSVQKAKDTSWKFLKKSAEESMKVGGLLLVFCIFFLPVFNHFLHNDELPIDVLFLIALIASVFIGIVTLIIRLLSNSLVEREEVKETVKSNQGIVDSWETAILIGKITIVILAIINTLLILIIHGTLDSVHHLDLNKLLVTLILGLCGAFITGGVSAFIHESGRACQQHLSLRIVLWRTGCIPWDYADFLDYASESEKLSFLNKIGGGYCFFHEIFKEYLFQRNE
jgi:MFS family permease